MAAQVPAACDYNERGVVEAAQSRHRSSAWAKSGVFFISNQKDRQLTMFLLN